MKKPWQIWLVFLLCLAVVLPAMAWLTVKTIQLDDNRESDRIETELARREAELQERISSALYRMDLKMLPLVAQEAVRPHYFYEPFYQVADPGVEEESQDEEESFGDFPSPLMFQPPEFVLLHFQIGPDQNVSSPQNPIGDARQLAVTRFGIPLSSIESFSNRLADARQFFDYGSLLEKCPKTKLPQMAANLDRSSSQARQSFYRVPAVQKLSSQIQDKQIDQQQLEDELIQSQSGSSKSLVQRSRGENRVNTELSRRLDSTQGFAEQQWAMANSYDNRLAIGSKAPTDLNGDADRTDIRESVMQPMWVEGNLILARRVDGMEQPLIQGCWLDWESIQTALKAEVADLLPEIEFQPIKQDTELISGSALTTLPVQLVVDSSKILSTLAIGESSFSSQPVSGLRMSLLVAWFGLGLATLATAMLLHGVMRLSERRAAFVSAVTHELRTPLTTFRMYAEMMTEQMVPEGKLQEYANTLKVQADRLSHLVENVLQFARLERGPALRKHETITVENLIGRFSSRLVERASQAEMQLSIQIDEAVSKLEIRTQPSTIEQILFNLVDNASKYANSSEDKRIVVECQQQGNKLLFLVRDHGPGVAPQYRKTMFQPFSKSDQDAANTAEGVGLGLALCCRMASSLGGRLYHEDSGEGATFVLELPVT